MKAYKIQAETVPLAEFKAHCSAIVARVNSSKKSCVITVRGVPMAELKPIEEKRVKPVFGAGAGTVKILGDIVSSNFSEEEYADSTDLFEIKK